MTLPRENDPNPYQSPQPSLAPLESQRPIDRAMVKKFRDQIHALGALWIIMGGAAAVLATIALLGNREVALSLGHGQQIVLVVVALLSVCWLTVGFATCKKQMWGVYAGLALSYLSLLGQVLSFNICATVIVIIVILQAHRVIGWAKQMQAANLPLNTKP